MNGANLKPPLRVGLGVFRLSVLQANLSMALDKDISISNRWGSLSLNVHTSADLEVSVVRFLRLLLDQADVS